jgi:UDP-3-O-[3-hydroxymyristoyl] glucosamine N-acyltransferase
MNAFARALPRPTRARDVCERLPGARLIGNPDRPVRAIGALSSHEADVLAFCDASAARDRLATSRASIVIVPNGVDASPRANQTFIAVDDVRGTFIDVVESLLPADARPADPAQGIHASATVDDSASISPLACIGANVSIGARTRIAPGAVVYDDTMIGADCVIGANAVIGWVGLAYHDRADGRRSFFPHLAGVRIASRVDVGAQACICRGMLSHTTIGDDVKIGSLVYVSHGVVVAARAWLSAGTAIAGHATIASGALLGIGAVVVDNVGIGANAMVAGGGVVTRSAAAGAKLHGVPAQSAPAMRRFGPTPRD